MSGSPGTAATGVAFWRLPRGLAEPFAALAFLTRIPVPGAAVVDGPLLARASTWFPFTGLVVGATGGAALWAAAAVWPPAVAVVLSTIVTVWLTGAFHEDALADAADGFGGGWTTARVLEIMRDSRVGAFGAVALLLVMALKLTALGALAAPDAMRAARALVAAHVLGRWSSLPLIRFLAYVRDDGTGKPFVAAVTTLRLAAGTAMAAAFTWLALGPRAVAAGVAATALTVVAGAFFRRRIGGITGDCLGAANQVVEVVTYLVVLA